MDSKTREALLRRTSDVSHAAKSKTVRFKFTADKPLVAGSPLHFDKYHNKIFFLRKMPCRLIIKIASLGEILHLAVFQVL